VSGLVGMRPRASYIMLPIPAACPIDVERAAPGGGDPADGTGADDGWALFSGTSAAAPQIAGAVAVLRGIRGNATPAQVAQALSNTAVDVRVGRCHPRFNNPAGPGRDLATGFGLINVPAAASAI
jgi:subtilisin family serine protease